MLGLKFSRLVHTALATGTLALPGCVDRAYDFGDSGSFGPGDPNDPDPNDPDPNDPDPNDPDPTNPDPTNPPPPDVPGPPLLIDAQFADNITLALTFSEPVAPTSAVDPTQFRLSAAFAPQAEYEYSYGTQYQEIGQWNGVGYYCDDYCYENCYYDKCYEQCFEYCYTPPGPPVRVTAITPLPDRPDILLLTLDNGVGGGVCSVFENYPEEWIAALFIHYTPQGSAPVTDNVGDALGPIGEHWALSPGSEFEYIYDMFPFMPQPLLPIPCPF